MRLVLKWTLGLRGFGGCQEIFFFLPFSALSSAEINKIIFSERASVAVCLFAVKKGDKVHYILNLYLGAGFTFNLAEMHPLQLAPSIKSY